MTISQLLYEYVPSIQITASQDFKKNFKVFQSLESKIDWLKQPTIEKNSDLLPYFDGDPRRGRTLQDSVCWTDGLTFDSNHIYTRLD